MNSALIVQVSLFLIMCIGFIFYCARLWQKKTEIIALLEQQKSETKLWQERSQVKDQQLANARNELTTLSQQHSQTLQDFTRVETQLENAQHELNKQSKSHQQWMQEQKQLLKSEFEVLANQLLQKGEQSLNQSQRELLQIHLQPFREQLDDFRKRADQIHAQGIEQQSSLKTEIHQLALLNQKITQEAHELSTALRGNKKIQGNWGELILENLLEQSGLRKDHDYQIQPSYSGENGLQRPDVVVHLPNQKHLIVDAKVSLEAYAQFMNTDLEEDKARACKAHCAAIKDRIKELSNKRYQDISTLNAPDMVILFIPIESAFALAMQFDNQLLTHAINSHILVTTPCTLLSSLRLIKQLWGFEVQNKHALKIAERAAFFYEKLRLYVDTLQQMGVQLDRLQNSYEKAKNQLMEGKGNLLKQAHDFESLGVSIRQKLPTDWIDKALLELEPATETEKTTLN
ncbi:MAG: DNA recombination protein RmuC [Pseudomonadota bacterium]